MEIEDNPLAEVQLDREAGIVRLIRKPDRLDAASLHRAVDDLQLFVPLRERARLVFLLDLRRAPLARDEGLEPAIIGALPRVVARFAACALLIATPVGRLQAGRFGAASQSPFTVFLDAGEAERFLAAEASKLRRR